MQRTITLTLHFDSSKDNMDELLRQALKDATTYLPEVLLTPVLPTSGGSTLYRQFGQLAYHWSITA